MAEKKRIAKREPLFKAVATAAIPSRRAHGTLQPEDESIIVGYYTFQSVFSVRGLKEDANRYGERIFDVNSAYFFNHGGYEFAKQFYEDAYEAAKEIMCISSMNLEKALYFLVKK